MQGQTVLSCRSSFSFGKNTNRQPDSVISSMVLGLPPDRSPARFGASWARQFYIPKIIGLGLRELSHRLVPAEIKAVDDSIEGELSDEDDDLCPVECVKEFSTVEEFHKILEGAKETDSLVVVDFFKTSCGSCKYIEQGFAKLCRGSGERDAPVIFLRHNVMNEYDEPSEFAEQLRIKVVPLFHFYKDGALLEAFATRDKHRIDAAILKHAPPSFQPN